MKKRALSLLLALLPAPALAADDVVWLDEGYSYLMDWNLNAYGFSESLAPILNESNNKVGYINTAGTLVIPCIYDGYGAFSNGMATVARDGKWGYINPAGELVVPCEYDYIGDFSAGLGPVKKDGKWGYINAANETVVPFIYDDFSSFSEGLAAVLKDGKWGYINTKGEAITPFEYSCAGCFSGGLAVVEKDGKWGYINAFGVLEIPCSYDWAYTFSEGLAAVKKNEKWGYINAANETVIPFIYHTAYDFSEGLALAMLDEITTVVINDKGDQIYFYDYGSVVNPIYHYYSEGIVQYPFFKFIDRNGNELSIEQNVVTFFSDGYALVEENSRIGILKNPLSAPTAAPSDQTVIVDGKRVNFAMYSLTDANGGTTNYIRVRDLAAILNGTAAQFEVGWDGSVNLLPGAAYTGAADAAPFHTDMPYTVYGQPTNINGTATALEAIQIEYNGGGYTYYKLRDLGQALGFNVGWAADTGIYVETDKPYDPAN